jgi:hypothetical protein
MNSATTLCVGADVHLDEIVLRAVDQADGYEVVQRFRALPQLACDNSCSTLLRFNMPCDDWTRTGNAGIFSHSLDHSQGARCLAQPLRV